MLTSIYFRPLTEEELQRRREAARLRHAERMAEKESGADTGQATAASADSKI